MEIIGNKQLTRATQEALRKRVVFAVEHENMKQIDAVKIFKVSRSSITQWVRKYRKEGEKSLNKKVQGRPKSTGKLEPWQCATIVRIITDKCPNQLKMPWALWTREAVKELIFIKFEINLSISTVSRLLKKWGFTPQKPLTRAYERNPKKIQDWIDNVYPEIARKAKKEKAEIYWGDEMGMRSDHQSGIYFSPRGKTPVLEKTGKRFKCNMISGITNSGKCKFMIFQDSFVIEVFLKFLRQLAYKSDRKIYLIVDNHKVHHSIKVQKWLEKHKKDIQIFFLPAYAPELNPDELLNQDVKSNAIKQNRPRNVIELKNNLRSYMFKTQQKKQKIKNFFKKDELSYIAKVS